MDKSKLTIGIITFRQRRELIRDQLKGKDTQ